MTQASMARDPRLQPARRRERRISRRQLLRDAGVLGMGLMLADCGGDGGANRVRSVGSRPFPQLPEGTDTLPQVEHIIIVMMENHSFDNYFGMLDPSVGFDLEDWQPTAANPGADGSPVSAFHMPSTCQLESSPSQSWNASHIAYGHGRNDGFVLGSGPVAMGYWDEQDLPFYYGLARTFPLASRWFGSTLCQTYPNRRFLMAGTAAGIINTSNASLFAPPPPNGNIFERLDAHGISWRNYQSDVPSVAILFDYARAHSANLVPIARYFADAAAGTLPAVSIVDPSFNGGSSEENPDDIRIGEHFASQVIQAAMTGPGWPKTMLIWLYDEHGGYYDHVPPPAAIAPDDIPPATTEGDEPGGYDRFGFRVPAVVVSPYARRDYISTRPRDHTSILKLIERKWNLGALTLRDANADDLFDCLDFRRPAFLEPPSLPAAALGTGDLSCTPGEPGPIPVNNSAAGPTAAVARRAEREEVPMGEPLALAWQMIQADRDSEERH